MFDTVTTQFIAPETSRPLHPTMGQGVAERTYLRRVFTDPQKASIGNDGLHLNPSDPDFQKWYVAALNSNVPVAVCDDATHVGHAPDTRWEEWHEVAHRVALGNVSLLRTLADNTPHEEGLNYIRDTRRKLADTTAVPEHTMMANAIANGSLLMSGRHLQQGDANQANRNMEVFTNCATASTSFALFMLLLNGSGVGRDYSDAMMAVDWAKDMPMIVPVLKEDHPDFIWGRHVSVRDAKHLYKTGKDIYWHEVEDSREGWGKAIEALELTTYRNGRNRKKIKRDVRVNVLVLDFSKVREEGKPIMGMQGRPSSGPAPLMDAIEKIARIRGTGLKPWLATLYMDHYLAEPVLVGGARRSARMSTKNWRDEDILEFIGVKRPIEYEGMTMEDVQEHQKNLVASGRTLPMSFLWSSNNSVAVDADFWARVKGPITSDQMTIKAKMVYEYACQCAYGDGTGEPGFVNVDRLTTKDEGLGLGEEEPATAFRDGEYIGSLRYQVSGSTKELMRDLHDRFKDMPYHYIVNPCGEIVLCILGGFCVIADVVPFHASSIIEATEVAKTAARALIRVNTMDSIYNAEVHRTNRIGVGVTGIHEAAWKFFRCGFRDLLAPDFQKYAALYPSFDEMVPDSDDLIEFFSQHENPAIRAAAFWDWLGDMARAVEKEATRYAKALGVNVPHTFLTVKPSGSVSKLFGLSEGWHLPAMRHYIRWVQYHKNSPMLDEYRAAGYPVRELQSYRDHFIVGFPTEPAMCGLDGVNDHLVTAGEATMAEQFTWLRMGEFFLMEGGSAKDWLDHEGNMDSFLSGKRDRGVEPIGNQISYTMKYVPEETSFEHFKSAILNYQPYVRCVSVMPQSMTAAYEYLPEEQVSIVDYQKLLADVRRENSTPSEDVGIEHLDCSTGACPIAFTDANKEDL
jgi:hypothetical protein